MGDEVESSGYEYSSSASKAEKGSIRKRAKKFSIVNGLLHYTQRMVSFN